MQEFATDSLKRQGNVIEAWVENEQEKDKIEAESQVILMLKKRYSFLMQVCDSTIFYNS